MSVSWASLGASAAVAAVVTLAIEYAAKPRLEARKERILEAARKRRDAMAGLRRFVYLAARIMALSDMQDEEYFRDRTSRLATDAAPLMETAVEVLIAPPALTDDWSARTAAGSGIVTMLQTGDVPSHVWGQLDPLLTALENYGELFAAPRWQWRRRAALIAKITATPRQAMVGQ